MIIHISVFIGAMIGFHIVRKQAEANKAKAIEQANKESENV